MRAAAVLPLLFAALAGCLDGNATSLADARGSHVADLPAPGASASITVDDESPAPTWTVGTWFGHHVFFGADDEDGEHYNTIVTRTDGDAYFLATDDEQAAKDEAAVDIPILGPVRKTDLHVTGLGGEWDFFRFPMKDGLRWTSTFTIDMPGEYRSYELTHVAKFNPAIETPYGPRPGWDIEAHTVDGERLLFYDYVPDIGWYAHVFVYELETPEENDFVFHVMSMGRGVGWTGSYFAYEGKPLLQAIRGFAPSQDFPPEVPPEPFVEPEPIMTFTMDEGSTLLFGFLFNVAVAGAHQVVLVDPDGGYHEFRAVGAPEAEAGGMVELPAIPGEWRLMGVGAGAVWIHAAFLWQLTSAHGEL